MTSQWWRSSRRWLSPAHTAVMGIVNVTPDSFSDGGIHDSADAAVEHGLKLAADGADILDVGGESTRPGSSPVDAAEELARVLPVVRRLSREARMPVSVDTAKPEVMRAAVEAGATMINDVCALRAPGALAAAAELAVPVCLMHMRGEPRTMQIDPVYDDVVEDVFGFLRERVDACLAAGIARECIAVDPGFGFGKTVEHNLTLLRALSRFRDIGAVVLVGLSRKAMIGRLIGREVGERAAASAGLALIAARNGADIVRVHDVRATRDVLRIWESVYPGREREGG